MFTFNLLIWVYLQVLHSRSLVRRLIQDVFSLINGSFVNEIETIKQLEYSKYNHQFKFLKGVFNLNQQLLKMKKYSMPTLIFLKHFIAHISHKIKCIFNRIKIRCYFIIFNQKHINWLIQIVSNFYTIILNTLYLKLFDNLINFFGNVSKYCVS